MAKKKKKRLDNELADLKLKSLDDVEREHIIYVLSMLAGNRTQAAHVLGISLRGLRYKINRYDLRGRV